MSKSKSLNELTIELEKLEEMHEQARNHYTGLSLVYEENHEKIQAEQAKIKKKIAAEFEGRKNARKGMKNLTPTIKFLKNQMENVRAQIRKQEQNGVRSLKQAVGE